MKGKLMLIVTMTLLVCPLVTGCWGYKEFEHQLYPHAVALDEANGKYVFYIQVLDMGKLGKTESGGTAEGVGAWVAKAYGSTVDEAAHDLYQLTSRSINWGHVNSIVLTENFLKDPHWADALSVFTRFQQFRYTCWIFSTKNDAHDVLKTEPVMEKSPVYAGLGDPLERYKESSFVRPMRLNEFFANMREPASMHLVPEVSLNRGTWTAGDEEHPVLSFTGYTIFDSHREFVGSISRDECRGLRWIIPSTTRTTLNLIENGKLIGAALFRKPRCQVRFWQNGQQIKFQVNVVVRGTVPEKYGTESLQTMDRLAAKEIEREIYNTYHHGLQNHVDLLGLQESLYRQDPSLYHSLERNGLLKLTDKSLSSVTVKVNLLTGIRTLQGTRELAEQ